MPATAAESIVTCPSCGAKNRVAPLGDNKAAVCGRCKAPLPAATESTGPTVVTDATFAQFVERSPLPVLVDMWAPWCGPCRMIAPAIDALATEFAGRVRVAKMNTDENQSTASRFRIDSIPTLLIFKNGQLVDRLLGLQPKEAIAQRLAAIA